MRYLLDTNVVSELRKLHRAHPSVMAWASQEVSADFALSVVSVMEIEIGIRQLQRRDPTRARGLERWLDEEILGTLGRQLLSVDARSARAAARLHVPNPRPDRAALIAATALVHGLTVVTRNVRDFEPMGVPVLNPWEQS